MSSSTKRDFAADFYLSEANSPYPLPYIVYVHTVYFIHAGKQGMGRVEPDTRREGQQYTKLDQKYQHAWLYLQSISPDKHLPKTSFKGQFF
jgi:hypothetical protein